MASEPDFRTWLFSRPWHAAVAILALVAMAIPFVLAVLDLSRGAAFAVAGLYAVGALVLFVGLLWALQRSRAATVEADEQRQIYERLLNALSDLGEGVTIGEDDRIVYVNDAFCTLSGYSETELLELENSGQLVASDEDRVEYLQRRAAISAGDSADRMELLIRTKDGEQIPIEVSTKRMIVKGREQRINVVRDIRLRREWEDTLAKVALTDALTGLGNRRSAEEQLTMLSAAARRHEAPLSVAVIDIDHFKRVNDTYGHGAGDDVLKEFGQRLRAQLRTEDFAARWGGEEFVMILPGTDHDRALQVSERIRSAVAGLPFATEGHLMGVTTSIGTATGSDPDLLITQADAALYVAKRDGRNCVR